MRAYTLFTIVLYCTGNLGFDFLITIGGSSDGTAYMLEVAENGTNSCALGLRLLNSIALGLKLKLPLLDGAPILGNCGILEN